MLYSILLYHRPLKQIRPSPLIRRTRNQKYSSVPDQTMGTIAQVSIYTLLYSMYSVPKDDVYSTSEFNKGFQIYGGN